MEKEAVRDSFALMNSYILGYKAYHNATNQQKNNLACLQQYIPTALEKLQLDKDKPTFNILSIGAGDGYMDQEILKFVQEGYLNGKEVDILNTAVEPSAGFLDQYKDSVEPQSDKTKAPSKQRSVNFDFKHMTFEKYAESKHDQNQYDMVHVIHSLYYVDNLESALKHCYYDELGEKGLIACLLGNDSNLPTTTRTILDKHRTGCQRKPWGNSAAKFLRLAEKNSMKYEKLVVPFSVDVTSVFEESSEEGRHLLDFLTHEDNYRQTADQNEVKEVLKKIQDISTEDDIGRLIVNATNELILIYKIA